VKILHSLLCALAASATLATLPAAAQNAGAPTSAPQTPAGKNTDSRSATPTPGGTAAAVPKADQSTGQATSGATAGGSTATGNGVASASKLDRSDRNFLEKAAQAGIAEVEAGKLAETKGASDAVKQFGQKMQADHTKANEELKRLAGQKGVTLPAEPDRKHKRAAKNLSEKSGADFDKAYLKQQEEDHKEAVQLFEKAAKSKDADIKTFAEQTLPTLHQHHDAVDNLRRNQSAKQ
jgi:putative membrane protein